MAKKLTAKAPLFGNNRSHSCRATRHKQQVNLQKVTLDDGTSVRMSARELKTLKKYDTFPVIVGTEVKFPQLKNVSEN